MKLIIIKDNFDIKRILFRESKSSIKISYDLNHVSMIGITLNIAYDTLIDRDTYILIKVNSDDTKIFSEIDLHFEGIFKDYDKSLFNGSIKVKKHNEYSTPSNKNISITMNSIKKNSSGRNKVQIFSI
jgi:hypothetical protein|tara:strand:+ start:620 stop:1003 length:384 start_codon:yes stop_codon:yes gene_type:complete